MLINFSKYHGCGNDFICIDGRNFTGCLQAFAKNICRRKYNVGADGLVVLQDSISADFKMLIINADGSIPEMCGKWFALFCIISIGSKNNMQNKFEN